VIISVCTVIQFSVCGYKNNNALYSLYLQLEVSELKKKTIVCIQREEKGKCLQSLALQKKMKYDTVAVADAIYCIRLFLITYSFVAITNQTVNVPLSTLN